MSANSGPVYQKKPEHRMETKPAGVRVQVIFNGEVVADSEDAIKLEERIDSPSTPTASMRSPTFAGQ